LVVVDTQGRLVEFRRVPPQQDASTGQPAAVSWEPLFRAAGLDRGAFANVDPQWMPKDFADTRAAWEGPAADAPGLRIPLGAGAYRGRITSFYLVGPWTRPRAQQQVTPSAAASALRLFAIVLWTSVLGGSVLLARAHIRAKRADLRTAARLAILCLLMNIAAWAIGGHHRWGAAEEVNSFFRVCGNMLFMVALLWVLYLALEPYGRRFWPDGLLA